VSLLPPRLRPTRCLSRLQTLALPLHPSKIARDCVLLPGMPMVLCALRVFLLNVSDATILLAAVEQGDPKAADKLLELVYGELRQLATHKMAQEPPGQTLQPTALVHEAWLRLVGSEQPSFENRAHFFSAAAEAMRRILIDRARRRMTRRHGGELHRVDLDDCELPTPATDTELLAVHEALDQLTRDHAIQAEVVKLRYFGGWTNEETAEILQISITTVKKYWAFSRAWLHQAIKDH
jgi:RNA polymerase sigma factor (TIGR02999 family)